MHGVRVALENSVAVLVGDGKLIVCILLKAGDKGAPHTVVFLHHRGGVRLPLIEITNHGHALCVWCPNGKTPTLNAVLCIGIRAEHFVCFIVGSFVEKVGCKTVFCS